ncbi:MAG: DUF4962 domain-containing protein [Kiritimatiellae bacterium]|nr:DUF4962 domain-containing protein [Kiritimatiellia bacterium]
MKNIACKLGLFVWLVPALGFSVLLVDDAPDKPGEWGFQPAVNAMVEATPPGFCWRPQKSAAEYEVQASRSADFEKVEYSAKGIAMSVHCPPQIFAAGEWFWRFRFRQKTEWSNWSMIRRFEVAADAHELPLPARAELLARIPEAHPRLFVRPEQLTELRHRAQGDLKPLFDNMVKRAEDLLAKPALTAEPALYRSGIQRGSDEWRGVWWGNRTYVQRALGGAAELAFTWQLGGREEFGQEARRILMECAQWDPKGATGYRYNDEAGMPYNYYFARTYTFVHQLLSEAERRKCREVMEIRGTEMYRHLFPRHLWAPYASHSNRAWHFLGELGVAFYREIPEAAEWLWFSVNVFACVYPVWSDDDGGWHEGLSYWSSYVDRFTWWADVMQSALGIDAFDKPYFAKVGFYPLYVAPPGTLSGGFGDCTTTFRSQNCAALVAVLAAQSNNPYWQWYAEAHKQKVSGGNYIGFMRSALPKVEARSPADLPASRLFRGVGQAYLNTDLTDAAKNIQIHFKSSPFGTQSHGYNAQNSFLLYVGGERLFLRSGKRDSYGSDHHQNWMWHTKSDNCITVDGESQGRRRADAIGEITRFETTPEFDYVVGEAAGAYDGKIKRFTRRILFIKPEAVVIWDSLEAPAACAFEWRLHTANAMTINGQRDIRAANSKGGCRVEFLYPENLRISQTDQFDPPPRERIKLVEHHLTAVPAETSTATEFVTVLRPHFKEQTLAGDCAFKKTHSSYELRVPLAHGGAALVFLSADPQNRVKIKGAETAAEVAVVRLDAQQQVLREWVLAPEG